jgi:hypothetical protein
MRPDHPTIYYIHIHTRNVQPTTVLTDNERIHVGWMKQYLDRNTHNRLEFRSKLFAQC